MPRQLDSKSTGLIATGNGGRGPTMTSREIADLLGVRHDNVRRTIERLSEKAVIQLPPTEEVKNHLGQTVTKYVFAGEQGKRDSYVVVAQLSPEFTARLVDRWQELEREKTEKLYLPRSSPRIDVSREHRLTLKDQVKYAKMAGLSGNQALLAANRAAAALTGIDNLGLLGVTHIEAPQQEALLTPTDIGKRIGGVSARTVNLLLCDMRLQIAPRDAKGHIHYEATEAGIAAGGVMLDTGKKNGNGTPVRQLKWASSIVSAVEDAMHREEAA